MKPNDRSGRPSRGVGVGVVLLGGEACIVDACATAEEILGVPVEEMRHRRVEEILGGNEAVGTVDQPRGAEPCAAGEADCRAYGPAVEFRRLGESASEACEAVLVVAGPPGRPGRSRADILGRMAVSSPAMLFVLEPPNQLVLWAGAAASQDLGLSFVPPRQSASDFFSTNLHAADVLSVLSHLERRELADGLLPNPVRFRMRRADGGWRPMTIRPALVWRRECGRIRRVSGVVEDRDLARDEEAGDRSSRVLGGVSEAADALLSVGNLEQRITPALEAVARSIEAEVAVVWRFGRDAILREPVARAEWEWRAEATGIRPSAAVRQELLLDGPMGHWLRSIETGRERSGITAWMPGAERRYFEERGIPAVLTVPILVHTRGWGFVEFAGGNWAGAGGIPERDAARILARHLGHAIERDAAERRVRTLSRAVEQSPSAVLIADARGTIEYVNPGFIETNGLKGEEVIGEDPAVLASRDIAPQVMTQLLDCVRCSAPWRGELSEETPSGTARWLRVSVTPVRDGGGSVAHFVVIEEDVTAVRDSARALLTSKEQLHALTARLVSVREEERRMLSRELHDGIGQALTGLSIGLQALERTHGRLDLDLSGRLRGLAREVSDALADVRDLARRIRPAALDVGLVPALQGELRAFAKRSGLEWSLESPDEIEVDPDRSLAAFRFVQEALTNIVRHASGARSVRVLLRSDGQLLRVDVEDDGGGIAAAPLAGGGGLGLLGLRERIAPWGGRLRLEPVEPSGARAAVEIPLGSTATPPAPEGA